MSPVIVANFDCELEWARTAGSSHPNLKTAVNERLRVVAEQLLAFGPAAKLCRLGDATPAAGQATLAWGVTPTVEALLPELLASTPTLPPLTNAGWIGWLWLARCSSAVAAKVNHRRFATELGAALSPPCPPQRWWDSLEAIDRAIAALPADAQWVVKAPLSASGRDQIRRRGALNGEHRVHAGRLLERFDSLLFERWRDRVVDIGVAGFVDSYRARVFPPHQLDCDDGGVFRAIKIDDSMAWLPDDFRDSWSEAAIEVGSALCDAGYRGPYGIDGYVYRDSEGNLQAQRLSEINARLTFGHVARAQWERKHRPATWDFVL